MKQSNVCAEKQRLLATHGVTLLFAYVPGVIIYSEKEGRYSHVACGTRMDGHVNDAIPNLTDDIPTESGNNGILDPMSQVLLSFSALHPVLQYSIILLSTITSVQLKGNKHAHTQPTLPASLNDTESHGTYHIQ